MRITDVTYAFPDLLFILIMVSALRDTAIANLLGGLLLIFVPLADRRLGGRGPAGARPGAGPARERVHRGGARPSARPAGGSC